MASESLAEAHRQLSKGLAQGPYVASRAGVEPTTFRLRVIDLTNVSHSIRGSCITIYIGNRRDSAIENSSEKEGLVEEWVPPVHYIIFALGQESAANDEPVCGVYGFNSPTRSFSYVIALLYCIV